MALDLLMSVIAFAIIMATILGLATFIVDAADGGNPIEERRTPKFPCRECEHYRESEKHDEKCAVCCDGVSGEPRLCCNVRASKKCAKSARKVS